MILEELLVRKGEEEDIAQVLELVKELALYEKASHEVTVTKESMLKDGFGPEKIYDFLVAEWTGKVIAAAIFFNKYSTWKGKCVYLDDIIVHEPYRGKGIGRIMMQEVIKEAKRRKAARLEWQVLDWNEPAIRFYEKFEAQLDGEWINCRLFFEY
ncbi:MAG: GNAT family N-acetyltransferase [Flavobacteriales bacterium]